MQWDMLIILSIAILGVVDANLDRYTGRGLIARVDDWIRGERRHG